MDLITQRYKLNDVLEGKLLQIVKDVCAVDADTPYLRKGLVPEDLKFEESERATIEYITTKSPDRDREIVLPKGGDLSHYVKNPVVLWCHQNSTLPLGTNMWVKTDDMGLIAKTRYSKDEYADRVYKYLKEGFPLANSIGFIPQAVIEQKNFDGLDLKLMGLENINISQADRIFTKWLMLEYSKVPVPANQDAIQIAISKGLNVPKTDYFVVTSTIEDNVCDITKEETSFKYCICKACGYHEENKGTPCQEKTCPKCETKLMGSNNIESKDDKKKPAKDDKDDKKDVTKPGWDENDTSYRLRVREPSAFQEGTMRTVPIKKDKPRVNSVMGKLQNQDTMTLQSLIFPKEDDWTLAKAQAWVKEHPEVRKEYKEAEYYYQTMNSDGDEEVIWLYPYTKEIKAGRVISAKNLQKIQAAHDALGEVIKIASKEDIPEEKEDDKKELYFKERINKDLSKAFNRKFNIEVFPSSPSSTLEDIYCKYLECDVKSIYLNSFMIPSPLVGTYLSAIKHITKDEDRFRLKSERNFVYNGKERPLVYDTIKLNSEEIEDFLVMGNRFYIENKTNIKFIVNFEPGWYGEQIEIISKLEDREWNKALFDTIHTYAEENNKLKNECFSITGEFIQKGEEGWDDLILDKKIMTSIKRNTSKIKQHNANSRGILFIGSPGNGKTLTGKTLVNKSNKEYTFIWGSSKDFIKMGSGRALTLGFDLARKLAPSIFFLEDVDSWIYNNVDLLKTELDGINKNKGILTILTSNHPDKLPDALLDRPGRFHEILEFKKPDKNAIKEMINKWVGEIDEAKIKHIINDLEGYSGAHIKELCEQAWTLTLEDNIDIEKALLLSLNKLNEQRELINDIRKDKDKDCKENKTDTLLSVDDLQSILKELKGDVDSIDLDELSKTLLDKDNKEEIDFDKLEEIANKINQQKKQENQEQIDKELLETISKNTQNILNKSLDKLTDNINNIKQKTLDEMDIKMARVTGRVTI